MLPLQGPPESICIFRLSALGDASHVLPVIRSIQKHLPTTRITWIIGKLEHRLMAGLENVEFIVFDKRGGWPAIRNLRKQLAERNFDVLLHMQVAARANFLSRLVKAPVRLGWNRSRSRDFHHWFINCEVADIKQQHQVEGFLEFPRALGIPPEPPEWRFPVSVESTNWAAQWLDSGRPNIVISPCSSHVLRNWRPEYYAQIADFASQELNAKIILAGGPSELEQQVAAAIESNMKGEALNLVGKDTLEQSKAMLQAADLLISPDSGPVHIANALGTPVLGLYAATWSKRSGPFSSLDICADQFPLAAQIFRNKDPGELRWGTRIEKQGVMDLILPQLVKDKLQLWYEKSGFA